jgi:hypothetical protein
MEQAFSLSRTRFFWWVHYLADVSDWDWLWEPPPWQAHQRQAWPDQHQPDSGIYLVPVAGFADTNYRQDRVIHRLADQSNWQIPEWIDTASVDPRWSPDPASPPYIYEFPVEWGWRNVGGPRYCVPGATEIKYVTDFVARTRADGLMQIYDLLSNDDRLRSWRPNPTEPPYIYVFGNQWWPAEKRHSACYTVPGAQEFKYVDEVKASRLPQPEAFVMLHHCEFDSSWEPDPGDPPYIYVFGNQWWPATTMPTVEYHVPGATERKFMTEPQATLLPVHSDAWHQLVDGEWDFSWVPDPGDPPYIYVFGNQWHPAEIMPSMEYHVAGATERKFMAEPCVRLLPCRDRWSVPEEVKESDIDFSWVPDPGDPPYVYHFGTEYQSSVNLTYTVPGATEIKFAGAIPVIEADRNPIAVLDIFYLDFSNAMSATRFAQLKEIYPNIQRVRYVNSLIDTVRRCVDKTRNNRFWVISSRNDYIGFDFAWHPEPWQHYMTHVFGSQWNKWSDTLLVNRWEFERCNRWLKDIQDMPNLNFVTDQQVLAPADACDMYVVDHGASETLEFLRGRHRVVRAARYFDNYLDTFRRLLIDAEGEHVWVVSSLCDYSKFDFSWQPEAWQKNMLHVFPSGDQKFGDTFYVPVAALKKALPALELLDWFETVNFCDDQRVERWPMPVIRHDRDSHVSLVKEVECDQPLMLFTVSDPDLRRLPTVSLWREKTKTVVPLDAAGGSVIVPKNALARINTQFYDYAHIDQTHRHTFQAPPQDVIFISYDEPEADLNWQILQAKCPRARRLHGVAGMERALEAAADLSTTPWYFAVFAKTRLEPSFDFSFVPDYMQQPKHYIFNCRNSVNGLEYGHMGVIMYNCAGIREINRAGEWGLDYTLSFANESIPILSCHGDFNTTPYHTWRTAFRETAKLAYFESQQHTVEGSYRLETWLNKASGNHSDWCLRGAQDGLKFFETSGGDLDVLRHSFRWEWLRSWFQDRYGDVS